MDTTTGVDPPTPDSTADVAGLIDSLAHVDSADAPERAAQIARLLTDELDAVQGDGSSAGAEQLQVFDATTEAEE